MDLISKIEKILLDSIKDTNFNIVQVLFIQNKLQIAIEKNDFSNVSIDDCEKLSRIFSTVLDVEDIIKNRYILEVSSAGMDRPLLKLQDYTRFKDKYIKLHLKNDFSSSDSRKIFKGYIKEVSGNNIKLETNIDNEVKLLDIDFNNILKAKLLITDEILKEILKNSKQKGKNKNV